MNWLALLAWINDPTRTVGELRAACTGLGLTPTGNSNQLLSKLRSHVASQPDLAANATWSPTVNPVVQPTQPTRSFPALTALLLALVIGLAGLTAFMALKDDDKNGDPTTATTTPNTTASGDDNDQNDATNGPCRLEKDGTWSEGNNPHRIEVQGHGIRHNDFYPQVGVKSVSYIVGEIMPPETTAVWWGYGSQWSGDAPECNSYDWIADTSTYADARLDSGHSGLVVDMRSGKFEVVYNALNMSETEINTVLEQHRAAMNSNTQPASSQPANCDSTREDRVPVVGETWTINGPAIVNFWSNEAGMDQSERKLLILTGSVDLRGGGAAWIYPVGCDVGDDFAANNLPEVTLEELKVEGLTA